MSFIFLRKGYLSAPHRVFPHAFYLLRFVRTPF
uniref:Uncharacterized protein n=1 Tax=Anguilla anguilla TaxID=7936 RepID=A0A0E9XP87_ANGAN